MLLFPRPFGVLARIAPNTYRLDIPARWRVFHGKGSRDRYQQNIICECPLVTVASGCQWPVARHGSCDEPLTKLKRGAVGPGAEGPAPHPPLGPAREASSRCRRRRRAACPRWRPSHGEQLEAFRVCSVICFASGYGRGCDFWGSR